jgi:hypothetical protein
VSNKFARLRPAMVAMQLARSNELAYRSHFQSASANLMASDQIERHLGEALLVAKIVRQALQDLDVPLTTRFPPTVLSEVQLEAADIRGRANFFSTSLTNKLAPIGNTASLKS